MANLFNPTFRASQISAPTIPGADVGAFGKAMADMRLRDIQERKLEAATKQAEQEAAWKLEDRQRAEDTRNFLKTYDYDPRTDSSVLDRNAFNALNKDITDANTAILKKHGIMDSSGNFTGKDVSPEAKAELESLGVEETKGRKNILMTKDDAAQAIYQDVLRKTADPTLAKEMAAAGSSRFMSRADLDASEKAFVKAHNDKIDKIRSDLIKVKELEIKAKKAGSTDSKTTYDQAFQTLKSLDMGGLDRGVGQRFLIEAQKQGYPASSAMKYLLNNFTESGFFQDKKFAIDDTASAMVDFMETNPTKETTTDLGSFRAELAKVGSYITPRTISQMQLESGERAFDNRLNSAYNRTGTLTSGSGVSSNNSNSSSISNTSGGGISGPSGTSRPSGTGNGSGSARGAINGTSTTTPSGNGPTPSGTPKPAPSGNGTPKEDGEVVSSEKEVKQVTTVPKFDLSTPEGRSAALQYDRQARFNRRGSSSIGFFDSVDRVLFPNKYRELPVEAFADSFDSEGNLYNRLVDEFTVSPEEAARMQEVNKRNREKIRDYLLKRKAPRGAEEILGSDQNINIDPIRTMIDFGRDMRTNIPEPVGAAIEAVRGLPDAITEGNSENFAIRDIMSRIAQNQPVSDAELFEVYRLLSPKLRAKAETQIPML